MSISYPLTLPVATMGYAEFQIGPRSAVGVSKSPFTGEAQVYAHAGMWWEAVLTLPQMTRAQAEVWLAILVSLNGREGTFLAGDPLGATARGALGGTPLVNGGSQTGRTLAIDGASNSITGWAKAGDWMQLGTGSSTHLHKIVADANSNGSGQVSLEIWPALRSSPADNATVTMASTVGIWRLKDSFSWTLRDIQVGGISIDCEEAL